MKASHLLGLRIRSLRKKQALKQEGLATKANITAKYLSDIELGKENPTFDVLVKLSAALKIEPCELLNFGHELSKAELKEQLISFARTSSEEDLRLTVKFTQTISR